MIDVMVIATAALLVASSVLLIRESRGTRYWGVCWLLSGSLAIILIAPIISLANTPLYLSLLAYLRVLNIFCLSGIILALHGLLGAEE